jgi:capsular polysaccharide biosynthesis protein
VELRDYWTILRRRWWLPVLLGLLTALMSAWQLQPWQPPPPSYQASVRFLVGVLPANEADTSLYDPRYYAWLTSEYLVDDFTEVVRSSLFSEQVSARLAEQNIQVPAGLIQGSAATGRQHRILTLSFSWPDPAQLGAIAAAVTEELVENTPFYFQQLGTPDAEIVLLDRPVVTQAGPSLRSRVELPLRVLFALALGIGLLFLLEYMDTSVRSRTELEAMGLHILGEIPRYRR